MSKRKAGDLPEREALSTKGSSSRQKEFRAEKNKNPAEDVVRDEDTDSFVMPSGDGSPPIPTLRDDEGSPEYGRDHEEVKEDADSKKLLRPAIVTSGAGRSRNSKGFPTTFVSLSKKSLVAAGEDSQEPGSQLDEEGEQEIAYAKQEDDNRKGWKEIRDENKAFTSNFVKAVKSGNVTFLEANKEKIKEFPLKKFYTVLKDGGNAAAVSLLKNWRDELFHAAVKNQENPEIFRQFIGLRDHMDKRNNAALLDMAKNNQPCFATIIKDEHLEIFDRILGLSSTGDITSSISKMNFSSMDVVTDITRKAHKEILDVLLIRRRVLQLRDSETAKGYGAMMSELGAKTDDNSRIIVKTLEKIKADAARSGSETDIMVSSQEGEDDNPQARAELKRYEQGQRKVGNFIVAAAKEVVQENAKNKEDEDEAKTPVLGDSQPERQPSVSSSSKPSSSVSNPKSSKQPVGKVTIQRSTSIEY